MDRKEFIKNLSNGTLPSVLLFDGEDDYLQKQAWKNLCSHFLPSGMEQLNVTVLDSPETDQLISAAETLPFLADRRLILVRDHPALTGKAECDDRLIEYLKKVPDSSLIVFISAVRPDGRKKLYTAVKKLNGIVSFNPLKDQELNAFVTGEFRKLGRECDERTADFLIFTCGSDCNLLLNEIAKIASNTDASVAVHPDDISGLATPSTECTVFQMVDAVVSGQESRAFQLMRNLIRSGSDRVFILAMLLRQFRLLQHIKIMQFEKLSQVQIRSALGLPPYAADQYFRQASAWPGGLVKKAVQLCFDTEYAIKSGQLNAEGAVEGVMLKLLTIRKKD